MLIIYLKKQKKKLKDKISGGSISINLCQFLNNYNKYDIILFILSIYLLIYIFKRLFYKL